MTAAPAVPGHRAPGRRGPGRRALDASALSEIARRTVDDARRTPRGARRWLRCAGCGRRIAREEDAIARRGAHAHELENPHRIVFPVRLFRDAPGCAVSGRPTLEHTWFPGHPWRFAHCAGCALHLGWRFDPGGGDAEGFFGLIAPRLVGNE